MASERSSRSAETSPRCATAWRPISAPDLAEMAAGDPTDLGRAYEQVVARRLLDERHGLVERLARRGTPTLDVPADRLTAETVDRYLRIKARTQL